MFLQSIKLYKASFNAVLCVLVSRYLGCGLEVNLMEWFEFLIACRLRNMANEKVSVRSVEK